jgi:hypothetical protein
MRCEAVGCGGVDDEQPRAATSQPSPQSPPLPPFPCSSLLLLCHCSLPSLPLPSFAMATPSVEVKCLDTFAYYPVRPTRQDEAKPGPAKRCAVLCSAALQRTATSQIDQTESVQRNDTSALLLLDRALAHHHRSAPLDRPPSTGSLSLLLQAFLKDYNNVDQVLVGYPNAWKADEWVLLENVRNAAPEFDPASFNPVAGDVVEAQAKSSDDEPYSWWKATVKTVRGEFYMISYSSWEDEFNEILERDMLRPFNKKSDQTDRRTPLDARAGAVSKLVIPICTCSRQSC